MNMGIMDIVRIVAVVEDITLMTAFMMESEAVAVILVVDRMYGSGFV